jgi:hypothetical protein
VVIKNIRFESYTPDFSIKISQNSTEAGGLYIAQRDSFHFEKSEFANSLKEYLSEGECPDCYVDHQGQYIEINPGTPEPFIRYATYMKHFYMWDTTGGLKKWIKQPKVPGAGQTGVVIEFPGTRKRFSMYADNLTFESQMKAVQMFRGIRIVR